MQARYALGRMQWRRPCTLSLCLNPGHNSFLSLQDSGFPPLPTP